MRGGRFGSWLRKSSGSGERREGYEAEVLGRADQLAARAVELTKQGRGTDALPCLLEAVALLEAAMGPDHQFVGQWTMNLAGLYHQLGRYDDAEPAYRRALPILEKTLGQNHPDLGTYTYNLGTVYRLKGMFKEAEASFSRSLRIREAAFGPIHSDIATCLNDLGVVCVAQDKEAEAEKFYRRAIQIREQIGQANDSGFAQFLSNLAAVYQRQNRFDEAEPLFRSALAVREKALNADDPYVIYSVLNLARLYRSQKNYTSAEPLFTRALQMRKRVYGPDHQEMAWGLDELADLYVRQNRLDEARAYVDQLRDLARRHRDNQRYDDAKTVLKTVMELLENILGPTHQDVVALLADLVDLYILTNHPATEALPLISRITAIPGYVLGLDDGRITLVRPSRSPSEGSGGTADSRAAPSQADLPEATSQQPPPLDYDSFSQEVTQLMTQERYVEAEALVRHTLELIEKTAGRTDANFLAVTGLLDDIVDLKGLSKNP